MDYPVNVTDFSLVGYVELERFRYLYFTITLILYFFIVVFNSVVILIIFTNKRLHEPMYIFIAALLCNAVTGSTALYPKLLSDLLSEKQTISYQFCLLQAFLLYWYGASEFTLLSAMAYDRYVSICKPLQYTMIIKMSTVRKLLFLSWFLPGCEMCIGILLTTRLQLCKSKLNRIYCDNYSVVKLSCRETTVNNLYGLFVFSIAMFPPLIFIIFSYIRILTLCLRRSKAFRRKALQTCLPHLIIVINFSGNISFDIINSRLESNQIPHIVAMILSIELLLLPPLFNPIIYGLKLQEIFNCIMRLISSKNRARVSF